MCLDGVLCVSAILTQSRRWLATVRNAVLDKDLPDAVRARRSPLVTLPLAIFAKGACVHHLKACARIRKAKFAELSLGVLIRIWVVLRTVVQAGTERR